jgi:MFS family permease
MVESIPRNAKGDPIVGKKQLAGLFTCSLLIWTYGNGLVPLLPVYAKKLGAESDAVGYYMSLVYISIALSTVTAGWLSDKFQNRKTLLFWVGVMVIPATLLLSQLPSFNALVVLTAFIWFLGGMGLTLTSILAGMFSESSERGKVFGLLALTSALGTLLGGLITGPLADCYGYQTMFAVLGIGMILLPLTALVLEDKPVARPSGESIKGKGPNLASSLFLLLVASILSRGVLFSALFGTSLLMLGLGFPSTAISGTNALAAAITVPLPLLIGWLSDRLGRKRFLGAFYVLGAIGALLLPSSLSLWHFWLVMALMQAMSCVSNSVGSAMVADLVPKESLGRGMSLFGSTTWLGGIIGFSCTGYSIQHFGKESTFFVAACLASIAMIVLVPIRRTRLQAESA